MHVTNPNNCLLVKFLFYFSAERESLQYRIRCLESQVTNLESLIEEIDNKNNDEQLQAATNTPIKPKQEPIQEPAVKSAASLFGGPPQAAASNVFDSFAQNPFSSSSQQQAQSSVSSKIQYNTVNILFLG